MPIALYMDQHVPRAITTGLRLRGADVLTAFEDGSSELSDPDLLDRAGALGRVLFSQDEDLLVETARRQAEGIFFSGLVYVHPLRLSIGACIRDLEIIAKAAEPEDLLPTGGQPLPGRIRTCWVHDEGFQVLSTAYSFLPFPGLAWREALHPHRAGLSIPAGCGRGRPPGGDDQAVAGRGLSPPPSLPRGPRDRCSLYPVSSTKTL